MNKLIPILMALSMSFLAQAKALAHDELPAQTLPAQTLNESQPKAKSKKLPPRHIEGFYAGGGLAIGNLTATEDDWWDADTETGDSDTGYIVNAGYRFNRYFALELGYLDGGTPEFDDRYFDRSVAADVEITAYQFNAAAILPFLERFEVYAKAGLSFWDADADQVQQITGSPPVPLQRSDDGTDVMIAIGAGMTFADHWHARIEYQTFAIDDELLLLDSDYDASFGALSIQLQYRLGDGW